MEIVYEDKELIAVIKESGIASQEEKNGEKSMKEMLEEYCGKEVFTVHRLDKPVGGIMVYGKNKKSADFLSGEIRNGRFIKEYLAVVCAIAKDSDRLCDTLMKNQRLNISKVVNRGTQGGKEAILEYEKISETENEQWGSMSLVRVRLFTGRHHQIRVQMANAGLPIWGDTKYNKEVMRKRRFDTIGLFSAKLEFMHPKRKEKMVLKAKPKDKEPFCFFSERR